MPLPLPVLDDRNFENLLEEIRSRIPRYNQDWTNFNPSDPGITLLELFVWLSENALYRMNKVPEKNYKAFLELVGIESEDYDSLESGIKQALEFMNERYRAVTSEDYERLVIEKAKELEDSLELKAYVFNNVDLEVQPAGAQVSLDVTKPGHVSVMLIPRCSNTSIYCEGEPGVSDYPPTPTDALLAEMKNLLLERRLLTTRVHVIKPEYISVKTEIILALKENYDGEIIFETARMELKKFFDPLQGGSGGTGWPVGRDLHRSEINQVLEGITGVDYVVEVAIFVNDTPVSGDVSVKPWELIALIPDPVIIEGVL